jgi:hypothetical protein
MSETEQQPQPQQQKPKKYKLVQKWLTTMDGCYHQEIRDDRGMAEDRIEEGYDVETGLPVTKYICRLCTNGERGFCHNTVIHRLALPPRKIWVREYG